MVGDLIRSFANRKILILGFGLEGQSTYQFIRRHYPGIPVTIADKDPHLRERLSGFSSDGNLILKAGTDYLEGIGDFDMIFKSPGIPTSQKDNPVQFTSQADLVIRFFRDQVVGVTGTKGKSTTASLLYHILIQAGKDAVLVGNMGIPPLDQIETWKNHHRIIYELSSHQLEYLQTSPHIGLLLNLYQEHLDHYRSDKEYWEAKMNILRYQKNGDFFIYNLDSKPIVQCLSRISAPSQHAAYSLHESPDASCYLTSEFAIRYNHAGKAVNFPVDGFQLKGEHNLMNIMAVIQCCMILEIPSHLVLEGIRTFRGLEHRMEYAGYYGGIHFYNDSIATVPEATIHAVKTLKEVDTLILGGYDRGIDYSALVAFLHGSSVSNLIFTGQAGDRIRKMFGPLKPTGQRILVAEHFEEVMDLAKKYTRKGRICLLSPAAASYDWFADFKERGRRFKELARGLSSWQATDTPELK